jgi:hypothetical protein
MQNISRSSSPDARSLYMKFSTDEAKASRIAHGFGRALTMLNTRAPIGRTNLSLSAKAFCRADHANHEGSTAWRMGIP